MLGRLMTMSFLLLHHLLIEKSRTQLGWLEDYQSEIQSYTQMVEIAHQAFVQVKNFGLTIFRRLN